MDVKLDSRGVLKGLLQGIAPPRPLFLPIVFSVGARIENLPLSAFLANPTKITNALRQIRTHLCSDGVICYFDPFLEVEALGGVPDWPSSGQPSVHWPTNPNPGDMPEGLHTPNELPTCGRVPVAVEVIRRLKSLLRDECLLLAGIAGPFTLASRLLQMDPGFSIESKAGGNAIELASAAISAIAKAFLEAGANMIFIREEMLPAIDSVPDWASSLTTTINIIRFYEAIPVLLLNTVSKNWELILQQSWDCIVCPALQDISAEECSAFVKLNPANLGFALPVSANSPSASDSKKYEEELRSLILRFHPAIVTTAGDIPPTTDLKRLNRMREIVIA
jgi:uroporphyrinogen-III decarboxylase